MQKIFLTAVLLGLVGLAHADTDFKSNADVNGIWKLEYTKKSANASETIKREDTWTFKEDKVTISHIPRDGTFYDQTPVAYVMESGKLKIALLGRSDKFDLFSLVEKDENSMTLKGKFGDIYHFLKK